ncbi:MAG: chloride channel protein [Rikenellaceae bacterium]
MTIEIIKQQAVRLILFIYRYLVIKSRLMPQRQLLMVLAIITGLTAGLATYVFELLLHWFKVGLTGWFRVDSASFFYLIYPTIGIIIVSLFVKYIVKDNIAEGVTRVLYAMSKRGSKIKTHNSYTSILASSATIGFGGSVGPEAPIVLTGSAIGSGIGQFMRLNYKNVTLLLSCGAAAALSAIFKAPITGVIFVLEILMLDITVGSIIPLIISSVTAVTLMFFLTGFDTVFKIDTTNMFILSHIPVYILLGISCGFMSYYFTTVNAKMSSAFSKIKSMSHKWLYGGAVLGLMIFVFPALYGEGYETITSLLHNHIDSLFDNSMFYNYRHLNWVVAIYLVVTLMFKVVATSATTGAGGIGGTFAPSLFVGAMTGATITYILNAFFGFNLPIMPFTLVGMAGVMAGVMKAPLTSVFLIAELSNGYSLFVPLMLVAASSFGISYYFEPDSIYTKKLKQRGELLTHNKDRSVMVFLNLSKLMETNFYPISMNTKLGEVVDLISSVRRNIFPVVSSQGTLLGVVQLDDLRVDMFNQQKYRNPIDDYMIPAPDVIYEDEAIPTIIKKFDDSSVWMLPVVSRNMKYKGFISKSRILAAYREQLLELTEE